MIEQDLNDPKLFDEMDKTFKKYRYDEFRDFLIGSNPNNDIVYQSGNIEEVMAKITRVNDKIVIEAIGESKDIYLNSKKVKLTKGNRDVAEISFKGFNVLLAWKEFGSEFICIEPWRNLPDCTISANDTIDNKFGIIAVKKGKAKKLSQNIKYFA